MNVKTLLPALLTVVGSSALGAAHGLWVARMMPAAGAPIPAPVAAAHDVGEDKGGARVREMKPIVVNLAAPDGAWLRLEAALIFDRAGLQDADAVAAELSSDYVAFLRTLSVQQIAGADGLQLLREELEERAAVRSKSAIHAVAIETLVIQ